MSLLVTSFLIIESNEENKAELIETVFDKFDIRNSTQILLEVNEGLPEWNIRKTALKKYTLNYFAAQKIVLADFSKLTRKQMPKPLINDIYKLSLNLNEIGRAHV